MPDGESIRVVCPYCVQWRCAKNHGDCALDDGTCAYIHGYEAYWVDGSPARLTQDEPCERCAQALADYQADVERTGF